MQKFLSEIFKINKIFSDLRPRSLHLIFLAFAKSFTFGKKKFPIKVVKGVNLRRLLKFINTFQKEVIKKKVKILSCTERNYFSIREIIKSPHQLEPPPT